MKLQKQTIRFCVVTPSGRGAVATVALLGEDCVEIVNRIFRSKRNRTISADDFGAIIYGNWVSNENRGEDLVVCPIDSCRIDIHCHGGDVAARIITQSLAANGAVECDPTEFASQILGNRYFADLQMAIAHSETERTAKILWDQPLWHEKFLHKLSELTDQKNGRLAGAQIDECLRWQQFGMRVVDGWTITLCGEPNVGKSSIANGILGFDRAIVNSQAGTTRDSVEAKTAIDGWPIRLIDTAGIHESNDEIERQGIAQSRQKVAAADFVVLVVDSTTATDQKIASQRSHLNPDIVIGNKSDLTQFDTDQIDIAVSAKTGSKIDELVELIGLKISSTAPPNKQPFPVSVYQVTSLAALRQYLQTSYWNDARNLMSQLQLEVR